ncbi:hypothetical protein Sinac_3533 [Singulisphaera acidiphila DSM 18658]|uniref:Uncharacterized protein n=1 Tax=Singulisphaera acidiphila (strain ATCC BAA-1392 / DSM 18658 / VKM B-2454 / MOB10) TaxID=886293 RepID=L0DEJ1_SINAD|nr:hypothetical protein Sinac_3533 [Singulisphaera acidiphila DSM 18658]
MRFPFQFYLGPRTVQAKPPPNETVQPSPRRVQADKITQWGCAVLKRQVADDATLVEGVEPHALKGTTRLENGQDLGIISTFSFCRGVIALLASLPLIIHERLGSWTRQLRPRLVAWPIRLMESRSRADLEGALAGTACPILVIDLERRPRAGLDDLERATRTAPSALILVLDPGAHDDVALLARELGATHVYSGVVTPPTVARLLERWIVLAQRRTEADGWSSARKPEPEPEPWNWLAPYLTPARPGPTWPRP